MEAVYFAEMELTTASRENEFPSNLSRSKILEPGETEAGSGEEQPTRDNRRDDAFVVALVAPASSGKLVEKT